MKLPELQDGETYVGAIGDKQGNLYHIILLPQDSDDAPWQEQMDWAKSIGGDLPTRAEQALIWQNCRNQMQKDMYWSKETCVSDLFRAWGHQFGLDIQANTNKHNRFTARAVRRVPF